MSTVTIAGQDKPTQSVVIIDGTAGAPIGTASNPLVTTTGTPSGTSATKQEDVASADGDYGSASLWVRRDGNTVQTNADGDYTNPAVNSAGSVKVVGDTLSGATDAGTAPVLAGAVYVATPGALTDGQRTKLLTDARGNLNVTLFASGSSSSGLSSVVSNADSIAASAVANKLQVASLGYNFNGTSFDRARGDAVGSYFVETPTGAAANSLTVQATTVVASSLILKAAAGNLYGYNIVTGPSAGYLMFFNSATAPADGTVTPFLCVPIAANTGLDRQFAKPLRFSTGCVAVFSTTGPFTKTASATAFIAGEVV